MKVKFDPKALVYFVVMMLSVFLIAFLVKVGAPYFETHSGTFVVLALMLLFLVLLYKILQIPICVKLGLYAKGEQVAKRALARAGDSPAAVAIRFSLFYFYFQQGKLAEAESTMDSINYADLPDEIVPLLDINRATLNMANDRFQTAFDILHRYSIEDFNAKTGPLFLNSLAFSYFGLGVNLDEGVEILDRAFKMTPDPRFAGTFAALLYRTYQLEAALAWADYGIKRLRRREHYSRSWVYYIKALILHTMAKNSAALLSIENGLKICPATPLRDKLIVLKQTVVSADK